MSDRSENGRDDASWRKGFVVVGAPHHHYRDGDCYGGFHVEEREEGSRYVVALWEEEEEEVEENGIVVVLLIREGEIFE